MALPPSPVTSRSRAPAARTAAPARGVALLRLAGRPGAGVERPPSTREGPFVAHHPAPAPTRVGVPVPALRGALDPQWLATRDAPPTTVLVDGCDGPWVGVPPGQGHPFGPVVGSPRDEGATLTGTFARSPGGRVSSRIRERTRR